MFVYNHKDYGKLYLPHPSERLKKYIDDRIPEGYIHYNHFPIRDFLRCGYDKNYAIVDSKWMVGWDLDHIANDVIDWLIHEGIISFSKKGCVAIELRML